jgi:DNA-binding transcriptional ArsR family regulator
MVTRQHTRSSSSFGAIADPTRRAILDALRAAEHSAGELAARFPVSRPAISRHVRILKRAGLIRERRHLRSRLYSLDGRALGEVDAWLAPYRLFWGARLQDLRQFVENEGAPK